MTYSKFSLYNVAGAVLWVTSFVFLGQIFASNEVVQNNFSLVILGIIVLSVIPIIIEFFRKKASTDK